MWMRRSRALRGVRIAPRGYLTVGRRFHSLALYTCKSQPRGYINWPRQDLINELFRTNANVTRIEYLFRLCMSDVELLKVAVESSRWKATMTAVRASVEGVQTRLKDAQKRLNDLMWSSREASGGIQHTLTDFVCIVAPCLNDPSITRDCKFKELGFCIEKMEEHEAVALGVANEFYELCEHISATMEDCMSLPEQICAVVKEDVLGALIETFTGGSVDEIDIITTLTIPALSLFFRTAKCSFEFWKIHRGECTC
ncbi:hypothetical protein BXZ70DRAFT_470471 [Cristinia sonorae]|uniref:Uncharacterized protein n=1 Tax=Cristinia sonorae TaxID=1940300 RepID=A0A8K0UIE6_9AGAR|nr:hypothetical protein BXZ70DRAFT_470471 [Cristinia sonorae]